MKPKTPASLDFRLALTPEIDRVLTARARALGEDKASVARHVLSRWAAEELEVARCLMDESELPERRQPRKALTRKQINTVFARDGFKCRKCGCEPGVEALHIDHIMPVSAGGTNDPNNLQVLCADCNLKKSNKIVEFSSADDGVERKGRK